MSTNNTIPYQLQVIIDSMLNKDDSVHIRGNYKFRLETIKKEIDRAIAVYDRELMFVDSNRKSNKKKARIRA